MNISITSDKLDASIEKIISAKRFEFSISAAKLDSISPLNTLARGYAIVQESSGRALSSIDGISIGDIIDIRLSNGVIEANVEKIHRNGDNY